MRKKICVLTSAHLPFDVRIFHKECKSLVARGYEVVLIAPHHESLIKDGVRVVATTPRTSRLARATLGVASILIAALRENAEVYHFHDPELIPAGIFLRLLGYKVIYDIHENLPKTLSYKNYLPAWLRQPLVRTVATLEEWASRSFSALITTTAVVGARFAPWNRRIALVRNYPSLDEFAVASPHAERDRSFVYVGARITVARGAREMVEAVGRLPTHAPWKLQLAGMFDPPELEKQLQSLPGWQRTEVHGYLDRAQVAELMFRSFAGVVTIHPEPNYLEALSVKLFEYMAAGLPVIANNFPVYSDVVKEARCGLVVNPLNVQEIADAMTYLLENPEEAREMGERGRCAVLQKFNWNKEQQNLLDLYDELLFPAAGRTAVRSTN